ncbi:hypothetical protein HZB60_06570 [candidate division KSB1 bacterium]|nr:hypothetical protein [candidate division KSB1 bacterium]
MIKLVLETGQNFSAFLAARLIFVTVLLGIGLLYRADAVGAGPYLTLLAVNAGLSLGCWEWYRHRRLALLLQWFALSAAVIVDTLVLWYTGGSNSEFVFLYFFSVGSAGLLTGITGSMWVTLLATAGVLWLDWSATGRIDAFSGLRGFGYGVNFALTAALASYVHDRFAQRERRHRETLGELAQSKLDTQAILDSLGTGLVVLNREQQLLFSNPAGLQILGLAEDASGQAIESKLHDQAELVAALRGSDGSPERRSEMSVATGTGVRPVGYSISSLTTPEGELRGHIVLFNDLTRIKEAERQERERDRLAAVGMLSRDLAHEIRNPLATVRGCVEMLSRSPAANAEQLPYFQLALKESDRLNGFLADFLTFARLDAPHRAPDDLRELIRRCLRHASLRMPVRETLEASLPVQIDTEQISLAVDTILLTLSEWGEQGDELQIEGACDDTATVRFRLGGRVLSPEIRDAAFRPFSGVQKRSSGLALPIAMRAVHAHGGTLVLESDTQTGTYFELSL